MCNQFIRISSVYLRIAIDHETQMEDLSRRNEELPSTSTSSFMFDLPFLFSGSLAKIRRAQRDRLWSASGVLSLRELFNEWDFVLTNRKERRGYRGEDCVGVCMQKRVNEKNTEWMCECTVSRLQSATHAWYLKERRRKGLWGEMICKFPRMCSLSEINYCLTMLYWNI